MNLQGTLNFGHDAAETLCFGQDHFLTSIQIDITIKINRRTLWQTKNLQNKRCLP